MNKTKLPRDIIDLVADFSNIKVRKISQKKAYKIQNIKYKCENCNKFILYRSIMPFDDIRGFFDICYNCYLNKKWTIEYENLFKEYKMINNYGVDWKEYEETIIKKRNMLDELETKKVIIYKIITKRNVNKLSKPINNYFTKSKPIYKKFLTFILDHKLLHDKIYQNNIHIKNIII